MINFWKNKSFYNWYWISNLAKLVRKKAKVYGSGKKKKKAYLFREYK